MFVPAPWWPGLRHNTLNPSYQVWWWLDFPKRICLRKVYGINARPVSRVGYFVRIRSGKANKDSGIIIQILLTYYEGGHFESKEMLQVLTFCYCRPRLSRGNVIASRSKVRGFKPGWDRWIFSGRKNPEYKSSGRDFKLGGSRVWDFRLVKEP